MLQHVNEAPAAALTVQQFVRGHHLAYRRLAHHPVVPALEVHDVVIPVMQLVRNSACNVTLVKQNVKTRGHW